MTKLERFRQSLEKATNDMDLVFPNGMGKRTGMDVVS